MNRSKFAKAFILGMCITVFSSTAAFAAADAVQPAAAQSRQAGAEDGLIQKQQEIDRYVEQHLKEMADKGFKVTNTGVIGDYVEIGITPYDESNAEYLYKVFGRDGVKVVEGQQAVLMNGAADAPDASVSSPALAKPSVDEEMLKRQSEIDQYLFEQHKDEIEKKGFKVTHTAPFDKYVEIGITPYNEENAEFIYKAFGKDSVKVVEGQVYRTMDISEDKINGAELYTASSTTEKEKEASGIPSSMLVTIAGAALVLGGSAVVIRKRKTASR